MTSSAAEEQAPILVGSAAAELLRRHADGESPESLVQLLRDWERWSAELLESHLSYPVLAYYRSQHDRESWLAALTMVMDVCTLILVGVNEVPPQGARLTFAIARHAAVDLSQIFGTPPHTAHADRLPPADLVQLRPGPEADQQLAAIRTQYEPYIHALADYLLDELPPWLPLPDNEDDWQTSIWEHTTRARPSY